MTMEPNFPQVQEALKNVLQAAQYMAERHARREQCDFLGRMSIALGDFENVFDEFPESNVLGADQAERCHEALLDLAGLTLAQLAILEAQFPQLALTED